MVRLTSGTVSDTCDTKATPKTPDSARPQAKTAEVSVTVGFRRVAKPRDVTDTSAVSASTSQKPPLRSVAQVSQGCDTSRPIPDTTPALHARRRFVAAVDAGDRDNALHRLTQEYLPALRGIAEGCDQETLGAEIDRLDGRLLRGIDYEGPNEDRWYSLLALYEVLSDAAAMYRQGAALHPTAYLSDRVEQRCRR